jgi:hypothetical protein
VKRILALLLVLVMVFAMTACGNNDKPDDGGHKIPEQTTPVDDNKDPVDDNDGEDDTTEPSDETDPAANIIKTDLFVIPDTDEAVDGEADFGSRNPSQLALNFVEAIAKNHYDAAAKAFVMAENVFIDGNDIKFSVPRSDYKSIADHSGKNVYLTVVVDTTNNNDGKAAVTVEMKDEADKALETFTVKLEMNANNKWSVVDNNFYNENFKLGVPGDAVLYINGVEVSTDLISGHGGYNELADHYLLPFVGKSPKMTKVVGDLFEAEKEVLSESNNEKSVSLCPDLNAEDLDAALTAAEILWESLYSDYVNEVPTEEWAKYFDSNAPTSYATDIATSFESMRKGSSGYKDVNHHITTIQKRPDAGCFYLGSNIIVLNFQYQLDHIWEFNNDTRSDRHFSHIILSVEDGEYKIHTISDPDWFKGNGGFDEW